MSCFLHSEQVLSVDASSYHALAQNLVERGIFTSPVDPPYNVDLPGTFRPPLTPLFLAAMYALLGVTITWGRLGLSIISAFSCGLTYILGERLFGRWTGMLAGLISCVYPFFLLLVHVPLTEGLSIFLILLLFTLIILYQPQNNALVRAVILGFVFGLTMLNKAANIVVLPCLILWALWTPHAQFRKRIFFIGVMLLIASLTILPWTIRNYRILGIVVPVNTNGGWTLYLGNNPHTEKNLSALEQGTANGWIPPKEVFEPFKDLSFNDTQAYERRAVRLAWQFIKENPRTFLGLAWRKLKIFWSAYPHILDAITWYPLFLGGLVGGVLSLRKWKQYCQIYLLIFSSLTIPIMFTSMPRFRAPLIPMVMLFASFFFVTLTRRWYANRH
jgi:4-amino-4-deoxy-L-arabinose transferase-like glycosyltransferase